ncbi:Alpha/beta hydrolase fold-3 domain protein [Burkholderia sp. H160]|nr:Alpha/beta hydrolase fold-3 domain protein [Burkholderia sp. H160]
MQRARFDPLRLAPDVRELLAAMAGSGEPPLESLPLEARRAAYRQIGARLGGEPLPVREVRELLADGPAGKIPLRLYLPDQTAGVLCGVTVYLHGGGWTLGDLDSHDKICRRLVRASGCGVVSVDYRLAPEHPAPAGPEDVLAAIRWLARHAKSLGLDPERIAVAGDSAGGSLSAVACQRLRGEVPLRAQVLFYPSTDLSPAAQDFPSRCENGAVPPLTLELMHALSSPFMDGFDTTDTRLSPLREPDLRDLPPALIVTAECDVLRDDGRYYRDALRSAGVPVEFVEIPGMVHGFVEMAGVLPAAVDAIERAGAYLGERIGR